MVNGNWRLQVYGPPPPAASTRCYPTKLRWAPPNAISEYPTPGRTQFLGSPQRQQQHLPSPPPTLRWPTHPPRHQDLRRTHCDDGRTIYKQEPYSQHPHCTYPFYRLPFGLPPSSSRQNYSNVTGGLYEIPQVTPGNTTRARKGGARKRASIACQACRKRKIRCGGYGSDPGGKCWSCARLNRECSFQPISSSTSRAPDTAPCRQTQRSPPSTCKRPKPQPLIKHCVSIRLRKEMSCSYDGPRTDGTSQSTEQQRYMTSGELQSNHRLPRQRSALEDHLEGSPARHITFSGASNPGRESMVQQSRNRFIMSVKNLIE